MSIKSAQTRFSDFYCEHHSWLVNWLRRRLGSIHDANDLAQDTFVRLLGKPLNSEKRVEVYFPGQCPEKDCQDGIKELAIPSLSVFWPCMSRAAG
ncbi:sigma factor [Desulfonatronovibrio hydrogenovorans]|uniref:sigma factor n=1 Tax=Desulfonatronovibrio hydrogenovorans TaxID=53245 RepID=UPI000A049AC7|nr:sigma factor [Desulfonatronovibrio hydrogenovorans]